jgi:hypothetical protein
LARICSATDFFEYSTMSMKATLQTKVRLSLLMAGQ